MVDNSAVWPPMPNQPIAMNEQSSSRALNWLRIPVLLLLASMLLLHAVFMWQVKGFLREGYSDFAIFYCAGKMLNLGLASHLYDDQTQYRVQQSFAPRVSIRKGPLPYNHPPFEALLFAPLARLPYMAAFLCWDLLNVVVLAVLPLILRPHIALLQQASAFWFVLVSLAFFPLWMTLVQGQDTILLLLLLTLAYVALKRNADVIAGCWLGLGTFRFHLVLPVMLVLLLSRRLRTTLGFGLTSAMLGLISLVVVGWHEALAYPRYIWEMESALGRRAIVPQDMPNLRGFLDTVLPSHFPPALLNTCIAVLSLALIYVVSVRWNYTGGGTNLDLGFSLCLISSLLASYHAYVYDLSALFLAVLLVANQALVSGGNINWKSVKLCSPIFFLFLSPLQMLLLLRYDQFCLFAFVLILWVWGISSVIQDGRVLAARTSTMRTRTE
jgi:Glycosyltransferase family 87